MNANELKLTRAVEDFLANGGKPERAIAVVESVVMGLRTRADKAGEKLPVTAEGGRLLPDEHMPPSPVSDAARKLREHQVVLRGCATGDAREVLAPQTKRDGGPQHAADKAKFIAPPSRPLSAIKAVNRQMAKSLFDTYRLPGDDRAIGEITWKELQGLARRHAEAYRLLSLIDGFGTPMNMDAKVRDVIKEDQLREFISIAKLENVH